MRRREYGATRPSANDSDYCSCQQCGHDWKRRGPVHGPNPELLIRLWQFRDIGRGEDRTKQTDNPAKKSADDPNPNGHPRRSRTAINIVRWVLAGSVGLHGNLNDSDHRRLRDLVNWDLDDPTDSGDMTGRLLHCCCTVAALQPPTPSGPHNFGFEFGSGTGTRTLNLAVNRSPRPVQNWCSEFAECRCVPRNATVYHPRCCTTTLSIHQSRQRPPRGACWKIGAKLIVEWQTGPRCYPSVLAPYPPRFPPTQ